jgi:uncharacterized protein (TIGR03435 family)
MRFTFILLAAGALFAQTESKPSFEAAFIKANTSGSSGSSSNGTKGQLVMVNQSLKRLVERAYNVKPYQVTCPEWMENARFDVTAKYPEGTENPQRPAMLRTMLEERFKLAAHTETKELPGYALVVTKGGLKITPVEYAGGRSGTGVNSNNGLVTMELTALSMPDVADAFARNLDATVVDRTNAEGKYSFKLTWNNEDPNGGPAASGAAEFSAVQNAIATLGLHLQATKVPVQMIVVDHMERAPTEN